jgi:hypothetical protein
MVEETHISLSVRLIPSPGSGKRFYILRNSKKRFVQILALRDIVTLGDSSWQVITTEVFCSCLYMKCPAVVCTWTVLQLSVHTLFKVFSSGFAQPVPFHTSSYTWFFTEWIIMAKDLFSVDTAPAIALTKVTNLQNRTLFQVCCSFGARSPLGRSLGQFVVVLLLGRPVFKLVFMVYWKCRHLSDSAFRCASACWLSNTRRQFWQ